MMTPDDAGNEMERIEPLKQIYFKEMLQQSTTVGWGSVCELFAVTLKSAGVKGVKYIRLMHSHDATLAGIRGLRLMHEARCYYGQDDDPNITLLHTNASGNDSAKTRNHFVWIRQLDVLDNGETPWLELDKDPQHLKKYYWDGQRPEGSDNEPHTYFIG